MNCNGVLSYKTVCHTLERSSSDDIFLYLKFAYFDVERDLAHM